MTLASDQEPDSSRLSDTAKRLEALRDDVFAAWEARVREQLLPAQALQHPLLIDTLPVFYDNILESISPDHPRRSAVDGSSVAGEHGGERARLTSYDHAALIEEYQLLRWAIFEVAHREGLVFDHRETHAIHTSLDLGIREAVQAFFLVHSGFREGFAAALTHDLRGPLAASITALELILLTDDLAKIKTVAARALANSERMGTMLDELLHTMAFHSGQKMRLALGEVDIMDVAMEVQAEASAASRARLRVTGHGVRGVWDRGALKRVLENLVANAVKYGSPATPITIKVDETHGRLVLTVHNEGEPIPAEEQECVFQMYERAQSAQQGKAQGWGIGLPYVRAVAESHAGSVGLDSSAELGTTFVIDIPLDSRLVANPPVLDERPDGAGG
jgi:signal transduction histidine kinase